jgi:hypothetical protein
MSNIKWSNVFATSVMTGVTLYTGFVQQYPPKQAALFALLSAISAAIGVVVPGHKKTSSQKDGTPSGS